MERMKLNSLVTMAIACLMSLTVTVAAQQVQSDAKQPPVVQPTSTERNSSGSTKISAPTEALVPAQDAFELENINYKIRDAQAEIQVLLNRQREIFTLNCNKIKLPVEACQISAV